MLFDTHIHLDQFSDKEIEQILQQPNLQGVLAVATDLGSCERLLS
ncbi:deoxyribonuclease [Mannheimia varigena USDA-ARS-USMARC-1388]|nr:deoxyribonuclease [Mannheimia varigena USDA-ARS-USMARC-1388]